MHDGKRWTKTNNNSSDWLKWAQKSKIILSTEKYLFYVFFILLKHCSILVQAYRIIFISMSARFFIFDLFTISLLF